MAWQPANLMTDLKLVRSKDVAQWYGQVVVAWDSLLADAGTDPRAATAGRWRNLGYWTEETLNLESACRALATRLADAADVRPGHRVLDVGCGLGESTFLLDQRLSAAADRAGRLVGLDVTAEHIEAALARRAGDTPEFTVGSAVDLPFGSESFDRVLALECAFHFPDRTQFFAEAYRVLAPGGLLGLADVLVSPGFARAMRGSDRLLPGPLRRRLHGLAADILKMPTANLVDLTAYQRQLRTAGLRIRSVQDISDHVFPFFMRHWHRCQDPRRQEELLRATGLDAASAARQARAWRRQMSVLMLGWKTSRFVLVTAERPADRAAV